MDHVARSWWWWGFILMMNVCALIGHAVWHRKIITDHVARSWRFYQGL